MFARAAEAASREGNVRWWGGSAGGDGARQGVDRPLHHRPRAEQGQTNFDVQGAGHRLLVITL